MAVSPNEPLAMRIIFEDCLGYVRGGRTPFRGLVIRPAWQDVIGGLPSGMPGREGAIELVSRRYVASWDENADTQHCVVGTVFLVTEAGFLKPVTARARLAGLPKAAVANRFSPLATSYWSESETGRESGPERSVSFSLVASAPN